METNMMENETKTQPVPAIRSDSVVAYLSNLAAVITNIATDLNQQIVNITASMNVTDTNTKENSNG
jgi:hypothetical protein